MALAVLILSEGFGRALIREGTEGASLTLAKSNLVPPGLKLRFKFPIYLNLKHVMNDILTLKIAFHVNPHFCTKSS